MRVVYMGTPLLAVPSLQALHESAHEVVGVYSAPPRPAGRGKKLRHSAVAEYAMRHDLPLHTPASLKHVDAQSSFAAHKADIAVVFAYGLLLPQAVLDAYRFGCINVHPSALPRWRGAAPIQRSIMAGDARSAVCIMQMDAGMDTGAILFQEEFTIDDTMTTGILSEHISQMSASLMLPVLQGIEEETLLPLPQSQDGVSYAKKIDKTECTVDFTRPAQEVLRHIHGLSPSPGAYITINNERIKLHHVELVQKSAEAGTILDEQLTIACTDQAIRPLVMQRSGKPAMDAADCLRGMDVPIGQRV